MHASRRGFTLIEILVLIVVIGVALAGVLLVFQNTVRGSADPQVRKQALAIAEAMLDEVLLTSYSPVAGGGTRANFNDIDDYAIPAAYTTAPGGMTDLQGVAVPGLANYNVTVTVAPAAPLTDTPSTLPVPESRRVTVTVTVTGQPNMTVSLDGYRLNYAGP
jgi:MSHA pilin protein MshD